MPSAFEMLRISMSDNVTLLQPTIQIICPPVPSWIRAPVSVAVPPGSMATVTAGLLVTELRFRFAYVPLRTSARSPPDIAETAACTVAHLADAGAEAKSTGEATRVHELPPPVGTTQTLA